MQLKRKIIIGVLLPISFYLVAQQKISGVITNTEKTPLLNVEVYNKKGGLLAKTDALGYYEFITRNKEVLTLFFKENYNLKEVLITTTKQQKYNVILQPLIQELNEVVIKRQRKKIFALRQFKKIEGTAIYAGKKNEIVLIEQLVGNKAANTARQIYSQVVGLNIYENDDAGLQLNIGGRGLDPSRTANFNTRQNGYDISADVLGYPESYYTPPADALKEIQIVRGAASLQYGTQFGGLLNFKFKDPVKNKELELVTRQSIGSYGLLNTFNSLSGTSKKTSYYGYVNYKQGNGFRPNSLFNSINIFGHIKHQFSKKTSLILETTYLNYLAKQAGGLTDTQFKKNPFFSNRSRNWFRVNWNLWAVKLKHEFSETTRISLHLFGLNASRKALGFRNNYKNVTPKNPITEVDDIEFGKFIYNRDLIVGNFKNWGAEFRFLSDYGIKKQQHTYLIGVKYYNANNSEQQGAGSKNTTADFTFYDIEYPGYNNQSKFRFPNRNIAIFAENIFNITDKISITPGVRLEHIKTEAIGTYKNVLRDGAGNVDGITFYDDNRIKKRNFVLLGIGASYKKNNALEVYGNISKNYRSVTFSDIRTVSPTFLVDENITDEKGATADIGLRGKYKNYITYDIGAFSLFYNDRIGVVIESKGKNKGDRVRTNIGNAFIYGFESFVDINLFKIFNNNNNNYSVNYFTNIALTKSKYITTPFKNVKGNKVEFIPNINLKTGLKFGYKNFFSSFQFSYLSEQFTDATNAKPDEFAAPREGAVGTIPAYSILDASFSYSYHKWKLETGVNNLLNESYFTRRATGYPGPGIIPSSPRSYYITLQFKL